MKKMMQVIFLKVSKDDAEREINRTALYLQAFALQ